MRKAENVTVYEDKNLKAKLKRLPCEVNVVVSNFHMFVPHSLKMCDKIDSGNVKDPMFH